MENKEFLQSEEWLRFQERFGRKTFHVEKDGFSARIIEHMLPIVGTYFYIPRWPSVEIFNFQFSIFNELIELVKKEEASWIRIDPENQDVLELIKKNVSCKIVKAPHDMQPRETFVMDIAKSEEELLSGMKQKTRYNIKVAEKKNIHVFNSREEKYVQEFLRLVNATAQRKGITFHPENYYRKMIETFNSDMVSLYAAEYNGKIIAANLVAFYGNTAIYLHGATDDEYRNVMAPYLLQWQAIRDAKTKGYGRYDFGGVNSNGEHSSWAGITKFKLGFSTHTTPVEFLGSYDVVCNSSIYHLYRIIQKIKSLFV